MAEEGDDVEGTSGVAQHPDFGWFRQRQSQVIRPAAVD